MCDKKECDSDRPANKPYHDRPMQAEPEYMGMATRSSAAQVIRGKAEQLRRQAEGLERLAVIADAMLRNDPAEAALWELILNQR